MAGTVQAQSVSISSTNPVSLSETNLNGARVNLSLSGATFEFVAARSFAVVTSIPGVSIGSSMIVSNTAHQLTLAYDGSDPNTDFDSTETLAIRLLEAAHSGSGTLDTGTVNVAATVEPAPAQVMGVSVTAGGRQLTVTWTAVSGASGYKVQWKSGSEVYNTTRQATVSTTSHTISSLTGGTEYTVRVRATKTKADDGSFSDEATGTPGPGQVMGVTVTAETQQLGVTWTATPGASGYQVQWKSGSEEYNNTRQAATNTNSHTIPSLTGGTEYTLRVRATGTPNGPFSAEATGTPGPGQVMGVTVTSGPGQLQVTWTSVTGATGYKVQWKSGSQVYDNTRQATPTTNSHTITGLAAGTEYTVRVLATRSSTPDGPASSEATGTPGLAQVTGVRVTAGNRQLQVAWNTVLGASGYKVQWKSGSESYNTTGRQATTANTNYIITNLDPAVYTLRVLATRSGGADGPASNEQVAAPLGNTDYDQNNNNLIDLTTLSQLDAIRYDLDGNGSPTGNINAYNLAFPGRAATDIGCQTTCTGYELMNDLDFDTNGDGRTDSIGDTYWNSGAGWNPIGTVSPLAPFIATFNGNGHTIANLFINRPGVNNIGLFGVPNTAVIENLGLVNVNVTGNSSVGSLVGLDGSSTIRACYATGTVTGSQTTGGLVGSHGGTLTASYARVRVVSTNSVDNVSFGGLVGVTNGATITASYALGPVTGHLANTTGGLVGLINPGDRVTNSYWDTETTGQSSSAGSPDTDGKTTVELQTPTGYTGIYANWNVNVDGVTGNDNPWAFGADYQYPVLRYGRTQAQIQAQFDAQPLRPSSTGADVNQDGRLNEQDALFMYQTYLPALRDTGVVDVAIAARAEAWRENGRAVGGDLNSDGPINHWDALIMYYAYEFEDLLNQSAALRQLLLNGVRGRMPDTDATYRELLRRAKRLR